MGLNLGRTLRNMFTPPSSWDSFKRGTIAPVIREGFTVAGSLLGGPMGGAAGRTAGDLLARAAAGDNLERENLGSLVGRGALQAGQGALAGYGIGKGGDGALKDLFSRSGGGLPNMDMDALNRSVLSGAPPVTAPTAPGGSGLLAKAGDVGSWATSRAGDLGSWATKNAGPIAQTAVGGLQANALNQQNQMEQQKMDLVRQQYEDEQKRRKANAALYGPLLEELMKSLQLGGK